jgi:malate dehydrogenase (oxaloacetate-decarboxylating)
LVDRYGLLKESLGPENIRSGLNDFVRADSEWDHVSTNEKGEIGSLEVVKKIKPTVLIGCSTHAGGFTEDVVRAMMEGVGKEGRPTSAKQSE